MQSVDANQHWSQRVDVGGVKIIPNLTIAVESAASVDVYIFSSELEERCDVLEDKLEAVCLPVGGIVGEENISLDVCALC